MPKYGVDNEDGSNISADRFKGEGDVLSGRFEFIKRVGAGGMSTVYQALDRQKLKSDDGDPYVAVKILNRTFSPPALARRVTTRGARMPAFGPSEYRLGV